MPKKLTQEEFINKAKEIHGNKYDYSKTKYISSGSKIKYICKIHGLCEQKANDHLSGRGCKKCGLANGNKKKKLTQEEAVKKIKEIHGDKYDCSKMKFKNVSEKICLICKKHGEFWVRPDMVFLGRGCPKCGKTKNLTTEEFIDKAKEIHGDKYDYSLVDYKNNCTKIKIICPEHGVFEQTPHQHINQKQRCPGCFGTKKFTTEEFIEKSKLIHGDKYNYNITNYINYKTPLKIICLKHGIFEITPSHHLRKDNPQGCSVCAESNGERSIRIWLEKHNYILNRDFVKTQKFKDLKDKNFLSYDFYIPLKNLLIEFNGKQHYEWVKNLQPTLHDFHKQLHHDWLKRKYAKEHGIRLLTISYKEYDKIEEILNEELGTYKN